VQVVVVLVVKVGLVVGYPLELDSGIGMNHETNPG